MSKTLYAIKSNVSGFYWNDKKGTWTCYNSDPNNWYTKEELEEIQGKYAELGTFDETIIEKTVETIDDFEKLYYKSLEQRQVLEKALEIACYNHIMQTHSPYKDEIDLQAMTKTYASFYMEKAKELCGGKD